MRDEHGRAQALKRGGGQQVVSLDQKTAEAEAALSASIHLDDVRSYDLTWASSIVRRSWEQMQKNLAAEGKAQWLSELKPFVDGAGAAPPNQQEVADAARRSDCHAAHVAGAFASSLPRNPARRSGQHCFRSGERRSGVALSSPDPDGLMSSDAKYGRDA